MTPARSGAGRGPVDATIDELERKITATLARIRALDAANAELKEQLRRLELRQAEAVQRIDRMLDRLEALG